MKLVFDPNQRYQQEAIEAVTRIFEGQLPPESISELGLGDEEQTTILGVRKNQLVLTEDQLFNNIQKVQKEQEISAGESLFGMNFSVEMETGTGKTYVYLRTIYELEKQYGFNKYVIVVPSVAIREGVLKNLEITHEHFQNLYENKPINFRVYESTKVSHLGGFATNANIEVIVMNIDAFAKDENIINKAHYKLNGLKPIEFIQAVNPIVIVDEPQNMETEKRKAAIKNLNPLCTLRYSATHRNLYNLVYSLNPVKAYDLGLVKQIEVDSIIEENAFNDAFVAVEDLKATKTRVSAKIKIDVNTENGGTKKKSITVKVGDDLYAKSNEREIYRDGYIIDLIDVSDDSITFSNGDIIYKGEARGGLTDELMKFQIRKTVEEHLKKQKKLAPAGIKVLSLFFIDKVANYREYDQEGNSSMGKFAEWFEEVYEDLIKSKAFKELERFRVEEIHDGYFSQDKKGKYKDTSGQTKADDDAYHLIMKDKERLLDIENPLQFIFSHSALREGWDNPNVFQICTLNETKSDLKKRQEIGRGLRLAVNQKGERTYDRNVNRLTVIANEAYDDFAKSLQKEIEDECNVSFEGRIKNRRDRTRIKYRKGFEADPRFLEIWNRIKHKTTYRVDYDTARLVQVASKAILEMPQIKAPTIRSTKVSIDMTSAGIDTKYASDRVASPEDYRWKTPDLLGYLQSRTELTRSTLFEILKNSGRLGDALINPQLFLDQTLKAIRRSLYALMIDGIKYQRIGSHEYEMTRFEAQELEAYLNEFTHNVNDPSKTIYEEFIPLDSKVETQFALDCESSEQIKFYFKLPGWFKIPTPIGNYNPDWAVIFEDDSKIYFVAETKSTGDNQVDVSKLKVDEQLRIKCGQAHFKEFDEVEYKVVRTVGQLRE